VREQAAARGLAVAGKPDSHDICFIPDGDTRGWLGHRLAARPGKIVDDEGTVLGEHRGAHGFTVGQRRGLALDRPAADGQPRYVLDVEPVSGRVVVGPARRLAVAAVAGRPATWCGPVPGGAVQVLVQVRAHGEPVPGVARADGDGLVVRLARPLIAVAPGQTVVLYRGSRVLGSATVSHTEAVDGPVRSAR
jgi:tRNA-specific 2-thiouridylase